jgi:hypothetical protein
VKKLKKLLQKIIFSVLCFSLMLSVFVYADSDPIPVPPLPDIGYVACDFEYYGQKVKLSDFSEFEVNVSFRQDKHIQDDVMIFFLASRRLLDLACCDAEEEPMTETPPSLSMIRDGLSPIDADEFVHGPIYCFYASGGDKIKKLSHPTTLDAFGEAAHVIRFKFRCPEDMKVSGIRLGFICANMITGYNLEYEQMGEENAYIYYATDGEYIAFSDVSMDDAEYIFTGVRKEPADALDEPRGFWATFADLFDGCD